MLSKEANNLLTETDPGTPCGELLRRYWQPAALSEELQPNGPPVPLRLFGEDLVMFRDDKGKVGLLALHCSHRGADLSYGRVEDGGLRCIYHGWLYNVHGKCLETPGEPAGSRLSEAVHHPAYPCKEAGGVIFSYLGPGEPPLLPNYEVLSVPPEHRIATKHYQECNYLQALEGNLDPVHVKFLHRFLQESDIKKIWDSSNNRGEEGDHRFLPPGLQYVPRRIEETDFGLWSHTPEEDDTFLEGPDFVFPSLSLTSGGGIAAGDGYMLYWRVPIDNGRHWVFALSFQRSAPIPDARRELRTQNIMTPDYKFIRNQSNRYLQDREEQQTKTFTGMGPVFVVHDAAANETQGPIQDRTNEHLGAGDMMIVVARKMLLKAIQTVQEGGEAPGVIRDPEVNKFDPIFLKKNARAPEREAELVLAATGHRWVNSVFKS